MSTIFDNLETVLDVGQARDRFGICCPDCKEDEYFSIHVIASVETYLKYAEAVNFNGCCSNIYTSSQDEFGRWAEVIGGAIYNEETETWEAQPPYELEIINGNYLMRTTGETACVDNNFYSCITQISGLCSDFSVISQKAITEYNTLNGQSSICELKDFIENNSLTTSQAQDLLTLILDKGMVSSCNEDSLVMGSVESWLQYAEGIGITGGIVVP